jgi:hypothetical protein
MPAYFRNAGEAAMTITEIEILTDWLRGNWNRYQKISKVEEAMLPVE